MSLVLTLVEAPHPQPVQQMRLEEGEIVIGRSPRASWRIDDPDGFVSREHCTVVGEAGVFRITDTSSGGLFVDDARAPLGRGSSLPLRDGMQLRLGEFVLRVELKVASRAPVEDPPPQFDEDRFFEETFPQPEQIDRPPDLPNPIEPRAEFIRDDATGQPNAGWSPRLDPDYRSDGSDRLRERPPPKPRTEDTSWWPTDTEAEASGLEDGGAEWEAMASARTATPGGQATGDSPAHPRSSPGPSAPAELDLMATFLRGLGLDPAAGAASDPAERMEAFGREYRLMVEGLIYLLRQRAREKGIARIVPTELAGAGVNPLKFLAIEEALPVMVAPHSRGFAGSEAAIAGAIRDLAAHHAGTWRGTQAALRRMIDRFDPAALEAEFAAYGRVEKLLAGGRRAKLWELYGKRFREIAASAETRFLGEVDEDFRKAYERKD